MCVEKDKTLGGTCLNVGCIPSKVGLHYVCACASKTRELSTLDNVCILHLYPQYGYGVHIHLFLFFLFQALLHNSHLYHVAQHEFSKRGIDGMCVRVCVWMCLCVCVCVCVVNECM